MMGMVWAGQWVGVVRAGPGGRLAENSCAQLRVHLTLARDAESCTSCLSPPDRPHSFCSSAGAYEVFLEHHLRAPGETPVSWGHEAPEP